MDPANQYPIIIKKKIPYISELLLGISSFCLIIIAICFFLFMPALRSSNEMKVVSTITIIPEYVKWLILYSGIGLFIFWFLYKYIASYKPGSFSFNSGTFTISTKDIIYQILISDITKIELIDPVDRNEDTGIKFIVVIYLRNSDPFRFQLKVYNDCFAVIENLTKYDSLKDRIKSLDKAFLSDSSMN
jgi:hypothetical protein